MPEQKKVQLSNHLFLQDWALTPTTKSDASRFTMFYERNEKQMFPEGHLIIGVDLLLIPV